VRGLDTVSGPQVEEKPDDRNPEEPEKRTQIEGSEARPTDRLKTPVPPKDRFSAWGAANAIDSIVVQGEPSFQNEAEASRALERESK
jgi:hypothetical protein